MVVAPATSFLPSRGTDDRRDAPHDRPVDPSGALRQLRGRRGLVFAACGTAASGQERDATREHPGSASLKEAVNRSEATTSTARVGPIRAIGLGTAAVKGGRVFDMELDREGGSLVWELDVASSGKAYDVKLNARSGKVVRLKHDRIPDRGMRLLRVAKVSAAGAVGTATAAVKPADLRANELDTWHGRVVWEAELRTANGTEYDVKIDARTGTVASKKIDD
jgi:uncharacterized membrane protein YkoI